MDDYYNDELSEEVQNHPDHELFEQEVIQEDDDLLLVHTLLDHVLRKKVQL